MRALNVAVAAVGLVMSLPILVVVAVAVRLTSPGPILYTQDRIGLDRRSRRDRRGGRDRRWGAPRRVASASDGRRRAERRDGDSGGRIFRIYKFRTMRVQEPGAQQKWAGDEAARITLVGGLLRKYRLDELPQFVNVLLGDMNIVGPRPEQPAIFAELRSEVADYPRRQKVLPGITGWAQVNRGYDRSIEDVKKKLELDLQYIERRSFAKDLWIMLKTMPVMLFRKGSM